MTPKGSQAEGEFAVWYHAPTGRALYVFADEYLAQQFAVSIGSRVQPHNVKF